MLAGCNGPQSYIAAAPTTAHLNAKTAHQTTFSYTGGQQGFKVPSGVRAVTVNAYGAAGLPSLKTPALGGRTRATIPVTQGETLYVFVGGQNGYNGGGTTSGCANTTAGAGASDVREGGSELSNRIIVAGGGGGLGRSPRGGFGGGLVGGKGGGAPPGVHRGQAGSGGTQTAGGSGGPGGSYYGNAGSSGTLGVGGSGGQGNLYDRQWCGGGGGGGYYGGGGGGSGSIGDGAGGGGSGGGGGSSYAEPNAKGVQMWQGYVTATANGSIVFTW
jgi:hypothetical protein